MHRILTRLLECYITNILVINKCGIERNSGSSYMLGRGFEHANLTTTHIDSDKKLNYTVCKSNYQN